MKLATQTSMIASVSSYIYKGRDEHYVYDLLHEKTIKLNLKGNIMEYHHEFKSYLGQSTYGDLFDICGVYCGEFINPLQDPGCFEFDINSVPIG